MKALAQTLNLPALPGQPPTTISGPTGFLFTGGVEQIISFAIKFVFAFAGIGLLLMIVASGMTLLTSGGDAKKLESGKQRLTYAIMGFLIIFTAYWLVQILGTILGFNEITNIFK